MDNPNIFLGLEPGAESRICNDAKEMYEYSMRVIGSQNVGCLNQLIVDGFDNEQIWQQIELYNRSVLGHHDRQLNLLINGGSSRSKKKNNRLVEKRSSATKKVTFKSTDENDLCHTEQPRIKRHQLTSHYVADLDEGAVQDEENDESEEEKELEELLQKVTGKNMKDAADDSDTDDDFGDVDDEDQLSDSDDNKNNSDSDEEDDVDLKLNDSSVDKLKNKLKSMNDRTKLKGAKSIVDDKFFKLSEMEAFLDEQDKKAAKNRPDADESEESDDEDMSDDDDEMTQTNYTYKDFFDMPDGNETLDGDDHSDDEGEDGDNNDDEGVDDEDDDQDDEENSEDEEEETKTEKLGEKIGSDEDLKPKEKSSFEKRQEKLKRQIADLEAKNIDTKSWQMTGEVFSSARPENSLLQETLEFDYMTRQAPVITEETTKSLEDLIMQRIKDKAWDDVERKAKPSDKMMEYSKRVVVDQEKSKVGLGELYEQQFLKQLEKSAETKKQDPKHEDIRSSMNSLFLKLDALANFHYTPKPVVHDVKIVSNLPALTLEEKLPSAVSDAALRAPEEIQAKTKREFIGATEMTKTDKLRARRSKKKLQHEKRLKREEKEKNSKSMSEKLDGNAKKLSSIDQSDKKKRKQKLGETMNEKPKPAKLKRKMPSA